MIWNKFPVWYHLTFLLSLLPLTLLGAALNHSGLESALSRLRISRNKESTKALFDPLYDLRPRQAM